MSTFAEFRVMACNGGWNKKLIPKDKDALVASFATSYPAGSTERFDVVLSNLRSSIKKKEDGFCAETLVADLDRPDKVQAQGSGFSIRNKTSGKSTEFVRRQTSKASDLVTQGTAINYARLRPHDVTIDDEVKLHEYGAFRRNDVNIRRDHSRCRRHDANGAKGDVKRGSCDVESGQGHLRKRNTDKDYQQSDKRRLSTGCSLPEYKAFDVDRKRTDVDGVGNDVYNKRNDVMFGKLNDVERRRSFVDIRRENRSDRHCSINEGNKETDSSDKALHFRKAHTPDISRRLVFFEGDPVPLGDKPQFLSLKRFSLSDQFRRIARPVSIPSRGSREDSKSVDNTALLDYEEQEVKSPVVAVASEPLFGRKEAEVAERKIKKNICDSGPLDSFTNRYVRTAETTREPVQDTRSPSQARNTGPGCVSSSVSVQSRETASPRRSTSSGHVETTTVEQSRDASSTGSKATSIGSLDKDKTRAAQPSIESAAEAGVIRNNGSLSVSFADEAELFDSDRRKPLTRKWFVDISEIPVRNFRSMPLASKAISTVCDAPISSSDYRRNVQCLKPCLKSRREEVPLEGHGPAQNKESVCSAVTCRKSRSFRDMKGIGTDDGHGQLVSSAVHDITHKSITRAKLSGVARSSSLRNLSSGSYSALKCATHASNTKSASSKTALATPNELAATSSEQSETSKGGSREPIATDEADDDGGDRDHALLSDRYRQMLTRSIDHQLFPVTMEPPRDGNQVKLGSGFTPPAGARRDFVIYI